MLPLLRSVHDATSDAQRCSLNPNSGNNGGHQCRPPLVRKKGFEPSRQRAHYRVSAGERRAADPVRSAPNPWQPTVVFPRERHSPRIRANGKGGLNQAPCVSATPSRAAPRTMRPGAHPPLRKVPALPSIAMLRRQNSPLRNERALVLAQTRREVLRLPAHLCPLRAVDHARAHRVIASHVSSVRLSVADTTDSTARNSPYQTVEIRCWCGAPDTAPSSEADTPPPRPAPHPCRTCR